MNPLRHVLLTLPLLTLATWSCGDDDADSSADGNAGQAGTAAGGSSGAAGTGGDAGAGVGGGDAVVSTCVSELAAQCLPSGSCVTVAAADGRSYVRTYANGVRIEYSSNWRGGGILDEEFRVLNGDESLCYRVTIDWIFSGEGRLAKWYDASGTVVAEGSRYSYPESTPPQRRGTVTCSDSGAQYAYAAGFVGIVSGETCTVTTLPPTGEAGASSTGGEGGGAAGGAGGGGAAGESSGAGGS